MTQLQDSTDNSSYNKGKYI